MTTKRPIPTRLIAALLALSAIAAPGAKADNQPSTTVTLKGGVSASGALSDTAQSRFGLVCRSDASGLRIEQVRPGSQAFYQGLRAGDAILDVRKQPGALVVTVKRDGHVYQARLNELNDPHLQQEIAMIDQTQTPKFSLQAQDFQGFALSATQVKLLSRYNLEFMIDRSLSMRRPDCPGGLSRWDWCSLQAIGIAHSLSPYMPRGVTITRFAGEYDVHEHTGSEGLVNVLMQHDFQLGTRLAEPLQARLDSYIGAYRPGAKPLLIAIITDGLPWPRPEPNMVRQVLVDASRRMIAPGEVTVVFLQIGGDDPKGEDYLIDLGHNLQSYGARFQYVHTHTFDELLQVGLAKALVNAVSTK